MSYAIVYGQNLSTYGTRGAAMAMFHALAERNTGARLFAVAAGGKNFRDITPRLVRHEVVLAH